MVNNTINLSWCSSNIILYVSLSYIYITLCFLSIDDYMTHIWLIIAVLLILAVIVGAVLLNFFKIDLILAYRHLCGKDKSKKIYIYIDPV